MAKWYHYPGRKLRPKEFWIYSPGFRPTVCSAILLSAESTTKEWAAGLAAHSCLILQMYKDLQGSQWAQYDQSSHEWTAAKGIRKWAELNFTIYGHCFATHQPHLPEIQLHTKRKVDVKVCYRRNDDTSCNKSTCQFTHQCRLCSEDHWAMDCP